MMVGFEKKLGEIRTYIDTKLLDGWMDQIFWSMLRPSGLQTRAMRGYLHLARKQWSQKTSQRHATEENLKILFKNVILGSKDYKIESPKMNSNVLFELLI